MKKIFLILCIAALMCMTGLVSAAVATDDPVANFTVNTTSGTAPLNVQFTDISTSATSWAWDFNNDGTVDSTEQNPIYAYATAGSYTVNLTVTNEGGSDSEVKTDYITVEGTETGGLADTAWPKFQRDLLNTGRSPYNGPQTNNKIWSYTTDKYVYNSPVIGIDGTIYVGSTDKNLYALNRDGTLKWKYSTGSDIVQGAPTIGSDGTIYSTSYDGKLYALNPDGTLKWSYTTDNRYGSPAIGSDGTIYIGSYYYNLFALNPDGTLKWTYKTGNSICSSPAIGSDGTIYIGSRDKNVYALSPDGTLKWSYTTGGRISNSSPAIGSDGTVYIGSGDSKFYALNRDGTLKWSYTTGGSIVSSPSIGPDGTIYIGSSDNKIYGLNPDGTLKWAYITKGAVQGSAAIGADGTIYIGSSDNKIYGLNSDGTLKWSYTTGGAIQGSPSIGSDGTLYIGSSDANIYAFRDASTVAPVANFTSKITNGTDGYIPLTIQFTDTSLNLPTSWKWDFGDGTSSNQQNPSHTYTAPGTYTVNLTVSNGIDSDSEVKTAYITVTAPPAPEANFTAALTSGDVPLSVQFTDKSTGIGISWAWDFDNDGTIDSTEQNPTYTYATAGTYTVNLTVTNAGGSDNEIKTDYINVTETAAPVAGFTATPTSGYTPMTAQFNDTSTGLITSYEWDFNNDGSVDSTAKNASYTYSTAGTYTVNHTVMGYGGSSSEVKKDLITVTGVPELSLSSVSFNTNYPFYNNTVQATILNSGADNSGAFNVKFLVNGINKTVSMPGLGAGNSTTVNATDIKREAGDSVSINVAVDPENVIAEANESNNEYNTTATIAATGDRWQGGRFSVGHDLVNNAVYDEGNIGVAVAEYGYYTWFENVGTATYTIDDLGIPKNATIKSARLYQEWTWYGYPGFTVEFNGHESQKPTASYSDAINGQDVFDVTPFFNAAGNNTAVITAGRSQKGYYGTVLVVVYEAPGEPYRQIWINEGCDCLLYGTKDPYVAYTVIDSVSTKGLLSAKLTTVLPSGESDDGNIVTLNGQSISRTGSGGTDPSFKYFDITSALQNGTNELGINGSDTYFNYAASVLEVTKNTASEANFTSNVTNGNAPLNVKFTDTSTGTPTNWTWDLGDGKTSIEQNPTHIYTAEGNYTVKLTVSNSLGSDSEEKTEYITVGSAVLAPETNFSSNATSGNAPLSVQFKDESTNSPTSWEWNFGDDKTSTEQNPSHTYETVGTYTVNLTATNYGGSNSTTKTDYITVTSDTSAPVASFTPDASSGQVPFTVKFTDTSTGKVSSWNWDFGDGSTSTDQNPTHTYVAAGSYTVTLTATGPGGSNTATSGKPIIASASITSPSYNGGIPLTTAQNGTVSGGLWCDSYPGFSTSAQKTFTLPDYTKIKWARLYVTVYDGHMENNYRGNVNIEIDGNGDSKYEIQKTENFDTTYSFPGAGGIGPVWLSDHMNRVTSDYLMWYDLTDLISGQTVNVQATTTKVDSSFDGRVKAMTLVVAYDDGDSDQVYYWVNQGHDTVNPLDDTYTGSTSFGTSTLEKGWSSANLTAIFLASVDGTYSFQGTKLASGTKSGSYYGSNTWDISSLLTAGQDSKLDYNKQESNYYKVPLALMSVKYTSASPELPTADFKADVTNGTAPLTVNFTDQSIGSPTFWLWDFGDGTNATEQNPSHTYTAAGNYTVNLMVSSAAGNNSSQLVDLIKVTESPTPGEQPDLIVSAITPNAGEVFANEANNISAKVENVGIKASGPFTVTFTANGIDANVTVDALEAGANATVTIADPTIRAFGDNVTVTATADPENKIAESSEINNQMNITRTVVYNGYKGKRYTGGNNLLTQATFEGKYGLVYSSGNTAYVSGNWAAKTYTWSSTDLPIPAGSTVESARLYQAYTWNKMATDPAFKMSFNSNTVTPIATYKDRKSYGTYDYPAGLYVYDVTSLFDPAGNSITVTPETGNDYGIYGAYLVVIYNDPAATEKKIWINDEFDLLASKDSYAVSSEEATAYASFSDVNATGISNATAIAVLASGNDNSKSKFVFNDNEYTGFWPDYQTTPQIGFSSYNVTGNLLNGTDTARLQSYDTGTGGDSMSAMNVILVADYGETPNETEAPVANFTATPTSGTAPLTVNFKDQSTGTVSSYSWDFNNDGNVDSTEQSPSYTYAAAGSYTVNLTVTGPGGSDSEVKTGYIKVTGSSPGKPVAAFSASPASGKAPLTVTFTDKSNNMPTKWKWSFGDGASSTIQNPKHKYSKAGKYTVTLTVTNAKGSNTVTETDYIKVIAKPVAEFSAIPTSGKAPLSVVFTDTSTGTASGWIWDFGDGSKSFVQNPTHKYSKAGTYTVNLTVKNAAGSNTVTKTDYIKVTAKPVSNFTSSATSGKASLNVKFTDTSTGTPATWKWDFGDGTSSTQQNPVHKYSKAGTYTVILTVKNAVGSNTVTKTDYIKVTAKPVAEFSAIPTSGKAPLTVAFTDTSTGSPTKWKWSFGDGASSTIQNLKHKYSKAGSYTVTLTATNAAGSSTTTKTDYVKITA
jgi:PKD repeat protein